MLNALKELLEVRQIITLLVTILFIVLSFMGTLEVVFIQNVIIMVVSYYFGKSTALDKPIDK